VQLPVNQTRTITLGSAVLNVAALEQTAALVEGKVTPRLSNLLDGIKDEKKVSLAVADPKLGRYYRACESWMLTTL